MDSTRDDLREWVAQEDLRERLIQDASRKRVRNFVQIDVVPGYEPNGSDGFLPVDENGHIVTCGVRRDLRRHATPLRVKVHEGADPEEIRNALLRTATYIDAAMELLADPFGEGVAWSPPPR